MVKVTVKDEVVVDNEKERLADYAHKAWSGWMKHLFKMSGVNPDGSVTIPQGLVERWQRQATTPYSELPENEKDSDRTEAGRMLAIIHIEAPEEARLPHTLTRPQLKLLVLAERWGFTSPCEGCPLNSEPDCIRNPSTSKECTAKILGWCADMVDEESNVEEL